jgi:hypothetical protein
MHTYLRKRAAVSALDWSAFWPLGFKYTEGSVLPEIIVVIIHTYLIKYENQSVWNKKKMNEWLMMMMFWPLVFKYTEGSVLPIENMVFKVSTMLNMDRLL